MSRPGFWAIGAQRSRNRALDVNFERGPTPPPSPEAQGDMPPSASAQAAGEPPRHRRPKPRHGGVESFDDAALLAELGDEGGDEGADDGEETHEELERRLRREIAAMPDTMALEEAALMRDLASMKEEPDEGDVLMAQLMAEEEAERRAQEARKASASASASSASSAPTAVIPDAAEIAAMRDACLQEKREAVRLKRAGDIDGAKEALRRAKAIAARADEAEASAANAPPAREIAGDAGDADDSSVETLTRAVDAARREAVAHKRAGDMVSARAALTKSKELRVRLDAAVAALEASRNTERDTEHAKDTPKADDVDTMIAEAIGTVVKIISDDPDSKVTARRKKPQKDEGDSEPGGDHDDDDDDDDALLRRELGDDYEAQREHWGGDYHEPEPESETELVAARVAELENLVDVEKRTALERKRDGDHEGARSALRAMKAAQAELADASAMFAALED